MEGGEEKEARNRKWGRDEGEDVGGTEEMWEEAEDVGGQRSGDSKMRLFQKEKRIQLISQPDGWWPWE